MSRDVRPGMIATISASPPSTAMRSSTGFVSGPIPSLLIDTVKSTAVVGSLLVDNFTFTSTMLYSAGLGVGMETGVVVGLWVGDGAGSCVGVRVGTGKGMEWVQEA